MLDLTNPQVLKKLCAKYHLKPKKELGQHFLANRQTLAAILEAAKLKTGDTILEIGPGFGAVTVELAKRIKKVLAIEKDKDLTLVLQEILKINGLSNVSVITGDILRLSNLEQCLAPTYKLVANLPYEISSQVLWKFLGTADQAGGPLVHRRQLGGVHYASAAGGVSSGRASSHRSKSGTGLYLKPSLLVLMLQKEVAKRLVVTRGEMNLQAVLVQLYGQVEILASVSRNHFWPQPRVDSALIRIKKTTHRLLTLLNFKEEVPADFFELVRAGYSQRRRKLKNNLAQFLNWPLKRVRQLLSESVELSRRFEPTTPDFVNARAQDLSTQDWLILYRILKSKIN